MNYYRKVTFLCTIMTNSCEFWYKRSKNDILISIGIVVLTYQCQSCMWAQSCTPLVSLHWKWHRRRVSHGVGVAQIHHWAVPPRREGGGQTQTSEWAVSGWWWPERQPLTHAPCSCQSQCSPGWRRGQQRSPRQALRTQLDESKAKDEDNAYTILIIVFQFQISNIQKIISK